MTFAKPRLIDHESFIGFSVALTLLILGVVGTLGSDDLLCCFVAGNSLTWDDKFRIDSESDSFQEVVDTLVNSAIFLYIGAIIPWGSFTVYGLNPWRLVVLGILVMLVRRMPWVVAMFKFIPSLPTLYDGVFAGFFGPIGVGAVFYTMVALERLPEDGSREHLRHVLVPVNLFIVFTSIVVHGITLPIAKFVGLVTGIAKGTRGGDGAGIVEDKGEGNVDHQLPTINTQQTVVAPYQPPEYPKAAKTPSSIPSSPVPNPSRSRKTSPRATPPLSAILGPHMESSHDSSDDVRPPSPVIIGPRPEPAESSLPPWTSR